MITIQEFRASRREVADLGAEITDTGGDLTGQRGFLYAGNVYMTIDDQPGERYVGLVLSEWDYYRAESELPMLEEHLYEWAVESGAFD